MVALPARAALTSQRSRPYVAWPARLVVRVGRLQYPWLASPTHFAGLLTPIATVGGGGVAVSTAYDPAAPHPLTALYISAVYARAGFSTEHLPVEGQSTWYHVGMELPAGLYRPTTGQWNWLVEWHIDYHTEHFPASPVSTAVGVYTDYPVVVGKVGRHPRLVLRLAGGTSARPLYQTLVVPGLVRFNHWYDMFFHFVWSANPGVGRVQWFVDGRQMVSEPFPTLFANADGTNSYNSFGVYDYHLQSPWASTAWFRRVEIGPTRATVSG
jgi:hypothetical protein